MIVAGSVLIARPVVDRLAGEWRQQELAAGNDAAIPRYRNAVRAAYGVLVDDFEDALVSYEVGARPTSADGREIVPVALPAEVDRSTARRAGLTVRSMGAAAPPPLRAAEPAAAAQPEAVFPEAIIRIPKIGLSQAVVAGVSREHLKDGPGHYPGTALPGFRGNVVISGHRTTYTQPFFDLDLLGAGDAIVIDTPAGSYRYLAESSHVVSPDDVSLLAATDRPVLTLTTCTPKGTARQRLIVVAVLDGQPLVPGS
jgi:sortase A